VGSQELTLDEMDTLKKNKQPKELLGKSRIMPNDVAVKNRPTL